MTSPFTSLNTFADTYFIAGTEYTFNYTLYDSNGALLDFTGGSAVLNLAWIGQPDVALLSKIGTFTDACHVSFFLDESDTLSWSNGKYIQQPKLTDPAGFVFRPGQGIITVGTASV